MIEGDKVICIHDIDKIYDKKYGSISADGVISDGTDKIGKVPLTIGKTYEVIYINEKYCCVKNDIDYFVWYDINLFINLSEYRENKLQLLLNTKK